MAEVLCEEVLIILREKYGFINIPSNFTDMTDKYLISVYLRLVQVYDFGNALPIPENEDFPTDDITENLKHIMRCIRPLELSYLTPKPRNLLDRRKVPRILSVLHDKITARHKKNVLPRVRNVIKKEELQYKPPLQRTKTLPLQLDGNTSIGTECLSKRVEIIKEEDKVIKQENWISKGKTKEIIPKGRQIPRTPMKSSVEPSINVITDAMLKLSPPSKCNGIRCDTAFIPFLPFSSVPLSQLSTPVPLPPISPRFETNFEKKLKISTEHKSAITETCSVLPSPIGIPSHADNKNKRKTYNIKHNEDINVPSPLFKSSEYDSPLIVTPPPEFLDRRETNCMSPEDINDLRLLKPTNIFASNSKNGNKSTVSDECSLLFADDDMPKPPAAFRGEVNIKRGRKTFVCSAPNNNSFDFDKEEYSTENNSSTLNLSDLVGSFTKENMTFTTASESDIVRVATSNSVLTVKKERGKKIIVQQTQLPEDAVSTMITEITDSSKSALVLNLNDKYKFPSGRGLLRTPPAGDISSLDISRNLDSSLIHSKRGNDLLVQIYVMKNDLSLMKMRKSKIKEDTKENSSSELSPEKVAPKDIVLETCLDGESENNTLLEDIDNVLNTSMDEDDSLNLFPLKLKKRARVIDSSEESQESDEDVQDESIQGSKNKATCKIIQDSKETKPLKVEPFLELLHDCDFPTTGKKAPKVNAISELGPSMVEIKRTEPKSRKDICTDTLNFSKCENNTDSNTKVTNLHENSSPLHQAIISDLIVNNEVFLEPLKKKDARSRTRGNGKPNVNYLTTKIGININQTTDSKIDSLEQEVISPASNELSDPKNENCKLEVQEIKIAHIKNSKTTAVGKGLVLEKKRKGQISRTLKKYSGNVRLKKQDEENVDVGKAPEHSGQASSDGDDTERKMDTKLISNSRIKPLECEKNLVTKEVPRLINKNCKSRALGNKTCHVTNSEIDCVIEKIPKGQGRKGNPRTQKKNSEENKINCVFSVVPEEIPITDQHYANNKNHSGKPTEENIREITSTAEPFDSNDKPSTNDSKKNPKQKITKANSKSKVEANKDKKLARIEEHNFRYSECVEARDEVHLEEQPNAGIDLQINSDINPKVDDSAKVKKRGRLNNKLKQCIDTLKGVVSKNSPGETNSNIKKSKETVCEKSTKESRTNETKKETKKATIKKEYEPKLKAANNSKTLGISKPKETKDTWSHANKASKGRHYKVAEKENSFVLNVESNKNKETNDSENLRVPLQVVNTRPSRKCKTKAFTAIAETFDDSFNH